MGKLSSALKASPRIAGVSAGIGLITAGGSTLLATNRAASEGGDFTTSYGVGAVTGIATGSSFVAGAGIGTAMGTIAGAFKGKVGTAMKTGAVAGAIVGSGLSYGLAKKFTQFHKTPKQQVPTGNMAGRINGMNR